MRAGVYYTGAVLLTLCTWPMYRYMYLHATGQIRDDAPSASRYSQASQVPAPRRYHYVYQTVHPGLVPGERCIAGMVVAVQGHSYTPEKQAGSIVPCHGQLLDRMVTYSHAVEDD
jgi:hypothetical protein